MRYTIPLLLVAALTLGACGQREATDTRPAILSTGAPDAFGVVCYYTRLKDAMFCVKVR